MAAEAASVTAFAPAKVNLTLHVTGRRDDGLHLLDSLVVFPQIGDEIILRRAQETSLEIRGSQAGALTAGEDNLVLRAARLLASAQSTTCKTGSDSDRGVDITLIKRIPVASGIGGGSADAAATLRALARLWDVPTPSVSQMMTLGADVPACFRAEALRMQGAGEKCSAVTGIPEMDMLLVNPGVAVSTPSVFAGLLSRDNPPMTGCSGGWHGLADFCDWLRGQRNDLLAPAIKCAPDIETALKQLSALDPLFAGMSGSGATCFALFAPDGHSAKSARSEILRKNPDWWAATGRVV